jgi:hypothetical protein
MSIDHSEPSANVIDNFGTSPLARVAPVTWSRRSRDNFARLGRYCALLQLHERDLGVRPRQQSLALELRRLGAGGGARVCRPAARERATSGSDQAAGRHTALVDRAAHDRSARGVTFTPNDPPGSK